MYHVPTTKKSTTSTIMSSATLPYALPPLNSLPSGIYPPSSYPPPSYFEDNSILIYPAIIIPAKRTGEIQRLLDGLIFSEPKRKSVYPLVEGVDYSTEDVKNCKYNPSRERKIVLRRLGGPSSTLASTRENAGDGNGEEEEEDPLLREAMEDAVWQDSRVQALLESAKDNDGIANDDVAPFGKLCIRPSYIRLPATPYDLLTVDEVLRRIMPTKIIDDGEADIGNNDTSINVINITNNLCATNGNPLIEEVPSSFEAAGHVAHLNLREEALPYKYLIGKAILEKNRPRIRLVVNKIGNIDNEFRTFPMEILAVAIENDGGDDGCSGFVETVEKLCAGATTIVSSQDKDGDGNGSSSQTSLPSVQVKIGSQHQSLMQVEVREHGCRFQLDFARVYFNSRLQGEHDRLVQLILQDALQRHQRRIKAMRESENIKNTNSMKGSGCEHHDDQYTIVADAMAGVGPFAIPLTSTSSINISPYRKAKIICHANDLNPISYEYLQKNAKLNKCSPERLFMYNMDARQFIHKMNEDGVDVDHFIMNLPQLGPEFLDAFRGWKFHGYYSSTSTAGNDNADPTQEESRQERRHHCRRRPMIHVHCFGEKARTPEDNIRVERQVQERCETALGCPGCFDAMTSGDSNSVAATANEFAVRIVRDVGPRKNMFCVSFRLPLEVASVKKLIVPIESNSSMMSLENLGEECTNIGETLGKRILSSEDVASREFEAKRHKNT